MCTTCCYSLHQWSDISHIDSVLKTDKCLRFIEDPTQQYKQTDFYCSSNEKKTCNSFSLLFWLSSIVHDCLGTALPSYEEIVGNEFLCLLKSLSLLVFPCFLFSYFLFSFHIAFSLLQLLWPKVIETKIFRYSAEESPYMKFDSCIKLLMSCLQLRCLESP